MEYLELYMAQGITTIVLTSSGLPDPFPFEGVYTYEDTLNPGLHKYINGKMDFIVSQSSIDYKRLSFVIFEGGKSIGGVLGNSIEFHKPEYRKYTATVKKEGNVLTMTFNRTK